jgi:hypothetical protein
MPPASAQIVSGVTTVPGGTELTKTVMHVPRLRSEIKKFRSRKNPDKSGRTKYSIVGAREN